MLEYNPVYTDTSASFRLESCHPQRLLTQRKGTAGQDHRGLTSGDKSKASLRRAPKGSAGTLASCGLWSTLCFNLSKYRGLGYSLHPTYLATRSIYRSLLNWGKDGGWAASLPQRCSFTAHQPNLRDLDSAELRSQTSPRGLDAGAASLAGVKAILALLSVRFRIICCSQINSFRSKYITALGYNCLGLARRGPKPACSAAAQASEADLPNSP